MLICEREGGGGGVGMSHLSTEDDPNIHVQYYNKIMRTFMTVGKEKCQTLKVLSFKIVRRNSGIFSKLPGKRTHPFESKSPLAISFTRKSKT